MLRKPAQERSRAARSDGIASALLEPGEGVLIGFGGGQTLLGNIVVAEIEEALHGEVEIALGEVVKSGCAAELLLASPLEGPELLQVAAQRGEPAREDLPIHHGVLPL